MYKVLSHWKAYSARKKNNAMDDIGNVSRSASH